MGGRGSASGNYGPSLKPVGSGGNFFSDDMGQNTVGKVKQGINAGKWMATASVDSRTWPEGKALPSTMTSFHSTKRSAIKAVSDYHKKYRIKKK